MSSDTDKDWYKPETRMDPAWDVLPVTPGATALQYVTKAIRCNVGGSLSVTMASGQTRTVFFADGETRALRVTHILSATGASGIEAII